MATGTASKPLSELLRLVDEGDLVLPEIQRDFVWSKRSVLLLFDSLYRGLPIGHMLVWKTRSEVATRRFAHGPKGRARNFYGYLLDGQQRLTAISRVRDLDDDYPLVFALWPPDESAPSRGRFSWRSRATMKSDWYVDVGEVLARKFSPRVVIDRLRADEEFAADEHEDAVHASLSRLQHMLELQVGVTEYESDNYRDATELFIRFNSTGAKLDKTDLAMAELALAVPNVISEGMRRVGQSFSTFAFTRGFLVQALVAVHTGRLNLRSPAEVWGDVAPGALQRSWERTERGLGRVIEFLTGTVRWDSLSWLPSINALLPLIFLFSHGAMNAVERRLARKWLLMTGMRRYFSGSGHGELDRILRKLAQEPTVERLWASTKSGLSTISPEDFDVNHRTGPVMSLFVSMLRERGARDWERHTALDGSVVGHNADLEVHHFFPRALLSREGWSTDRINTFANYTVISKGTNIGISAAEPSVYIPKFKVREKDLADQCVPTDRELWSLDRYEDFLAVRRRMLTAEARAFLDG